MTDVSKQQKKDSILKSLAIVGFAGIIALIAWLSIQLINNIPSAFSSLASLAESINTQGQTAVKDSPTDPLTILSNTTLANAGEAVTISWNEATVPGSFTFSYQYADGVAIDLTGIEGIGSITCDTHYNIGNITTLTFTIDSEKNRYADVWYTISFLGTNDTVPRASDVAQLTVINSTIKSTLTTTNADKTETSAGSVIPTTVVTTPTITTPETSVTQTGQTTNEQQYTYTVPVSDPNGRVDLASRYLGLGKIVAGALVPSTVKQGEKGAVQFEIKNHGTKTSGTWTYTVTLPDGSTYESTPQVTLKPNERAVLTIGFGTVDTSSHTFVVAVDEKNDTYGLNDTFSQKVTFAK